MSIVESYGAIRGSAAAYRRGNRIVELTGPGRQQLLSTVVARPTEYAQPGTLLESLVLDAEGRPTDLVLCIFDETRVLLLSDSQNSVLDDLEQTAGSCGITDVRVTPLDGWSTVAIEGPKAWRAVADLPGEEIAGVLLNEWRTIAGPLGTGEAIFARTGSTAEYGYLVVAAADPDVLLTWMTGLAESVGGARCEPEALLRARVEANHPVIDGQFDGVSLQEAGMGWMAGAGREDQFRGRTTADGPPQRRLVAVRSAHQLEAGDAVLAGDQPVGRVHLVAPRAGQDTTIALSLLERPFDVPGLRLSANGHELVTVARPAVDPLSWLEEIE
ncbi:MAG: aminomethyl transferase family protein [Micrococcales bacterium]|nr:aminomethyl transferase family protein [Micrococcales bacterium]